MITVAEFHPGDLDEIAVQPMQAARFPRARRADFGATAQMLGPCWTARDAESGRMLFCGGFLQVHAGHAIAWCVMAEDKGRAMVAITRRARAAIAAAGWRRVDMMTDPDFPAAARWARMLGMEFESVRRANAEDGSDQLCWVRIGGHNEKCLLKEAGQ